MNNPIQEARDRIERAFRVMFERDPNQTEQTLIEAASRRVAEGEDFHWQGTKEQPIYKVGLATEQSEGTELDSDLLAQEADQSSRIKEEIVQYGALKVGSEEESKQDWLGKINSREVQYCRLRASGESQVNSYYGAGYKASNRNSAYVCSSLMEKRPQVAAYLRRLKEASFTANVLSLAEKRSGLADTWRTPVGEIDENHPLAQEVVKKVFRDKDGNVTGEETKVKMVSKLDALKLDAQLAGELKESTTNQATFSLNLSMERLEMAPEQAIEGEIVQSDQLPE